MTCPGFRWLTVWLSLAGGVALYAAAPQASPERLGKLAPLPTINLQAGVGLNSFDLLSEIDDSGTRLRKIRDLGLRLQDDPNDPDLLRDLGRLLSRSGSSNNALRVHHRRVEVLRTQVESRPKDGLLLADFGDALHQAGQEQEAESVLRRAAQESPDEWKVWTTLGDFLVRRALEQSVIEPPGGSSTRPGAVELTAGQLSQWEDMLQEGGDCMDRAVQLAPDVAQVYSLRAVSLMLQTQSREAIDRLRSEEPEPGHRGEVPAVYRVTLPDMKHAARLSETNARAWTYTAMLELMSGRKDSGGHGRLSDLPDDSREYVTTAMSRLREMSEHPDPRVAASALEGLTLIQVSVQQVDPDTAIQHLERAVRLDPDRSQAWDLLTGMIGSRSGRGQDLVEICRSRLVHSETIKNRFLLVKAFQKAGRLEEALEEAESVVQRHPDNIVMQISAAALLLQRDSDEETLKQAERHLGKARTLGKRYKPSKEWPGLRQDIILNVAVWLALTGHADAAQELVERVIHAAPGNTKATAIMEQLRHWQ